MSPPIRRCGLKYRSHLRLQAYLPVTSYTEVWIEIYCIISSVFSTPVTSYTEVWIEIQLQIQVAQAVRESPPIRRCGLKFVAT